MRFYYDKSINTEDIYAKFINSHSDNNALLHMEPSGDNQRLYMTFDVSLKEETNMSSFLSEFSKIAGISEVVLVSAKNDIEY